MNPAPQPSVTKPATPYQVLARKYRPHSFHELVGQEHVSRALVNAIEQNRLHHAYLFTGTRGVGKTTIARILAKCLNCETGITSTPCGVCGHCVAIDQGRFIDLIEIDAASRTKVEDTRELLENVPYAPTQGRYKVYLIDEVHMLSTHSFNALLKTLEEPPEHVKFLLATTDPQKLPITVISRCLQFVLRPLTESQLFSHLQNVLDKEQMTYEPAALWQLAHAAHGSVRDSLSLTDQAIAFADGKLTERLVIDMLGVINAADLQALLTAIYHDDRPAVMHILMQMRQQSLDAGGVLNELSDLLHHLALLQLLPEMDLGISPQQLSQRQQLSGQIPSETLQLYYEIVNKSRESLTVSHSPMQALEMCLLRLLAFRPLSPDEAWVINANDLDSDVNGHVNSDTKSNDKSRISQNNIGENNASENSVSQNNIKNDVSPSDINQNDINQSNTSEYDDTNQHGTASQDSDQEHKQNDTTEHTLFDQVMLEQPLSQQPLSQQPLSQQPLEQPVDFAPPEEVIDSNADNNTQFDDLTEQASQSLKPKNEPLNKPKNELLSEPVVAEQPLVEAEPATAQLTEVTQPEPLTTPTKATVAEIIHNDDDPRALLHCPPAELTGQWDEKKWDYWLYLARQDKRLSVDELALANQGVMTGDMQGDSVFVSQTHAKNFASTFERLADVLRQDFTDAKFSMTADASLAHTDPTTDEPKLPSHRQKHRQQLAEDEAKRLLDNSAVMEELRQQGNAKINQIKLQPLE